MNKRNESVIVNQEEETLFKDLYRKTLDPVEYVSDNERKWVEKFKSKYPEQVRLIDERYASLCNTERSLTSSRDYSLSSSASVGGSMLKAKVPILPEKSTGSYRISFDLLYHGELQMGRPNGKGQIISLSSKQVQYEGEVVNAVYNGKGCRYCKNVLYEEGEFCNGLIVEGVRYNPNGSAYAGHFANDLYDGTGRIVFPNGFFVSGSFVAGHLYRGMDIVTVVSIPSAKYPTKMYYDSSSLDLSITDSYVKVVRFETPEISYLFYPNGDVFVGVVEHGSKRGYFYRYAETSFERMIVDDVKGIPTIHPIMTIEADKKYKHFSLSKYTV